MSKMTQPNLIKWLNKEVEASQFEADADLFLKQIAGRAVIDLKSMSHIRIAHASAYDLFERALWERRDEIGDEAFLKLNLDEEVLNLLIAFDIVLSAHFGKQDHKKEVVSYEEILGLVTETVENHFSKNSKN